MSGRGRKRRLPSGYEPEPWHSPVIDSDIELDNLLQGDIFQQANVHEQPAGGLVAENEEVLDRDRREHYVEEDVEENEEVLDRDRREDDVEEDVAENDEVIDSGEDGLEEDVAENDEVLDRDRGEDGLEEDVAENDEVLDRDRGEDGLEEDVGENEEVINSGEDGLEEDVGENEEVIDSGEDGLDDAVVQPVVFEDDPDTLLHHGDGVQAAVVEDLVDDVQEQEEMHAEDGLDDEDEVMFEGEALIHDQHIHEPYDGDNVGRDLEEHEEQDDEFGGFRGNVGDDVDNDDEDDDDDPEEEEFFEVDDYNTILEHVSKEWVKNELDHNVSKVASQEMWKLAKTWFHRLFLAKETQNVTRKTPSITHLRRKMYDKYVPPIKMQFGYENKETGEVTVVDDTEVTPRARFPPNQYRKLWEIAHLEVMFLKSTVLFIFLRY